MSRLAIVVFVFMSAGCASLTRHQAAVAGEPLSPPELAIAEAALRAEIANYRGEWPVVVLDETTPWMPQAEEEPEPPADVPLDAGSRRTRRYRRHCARRMRSRTCWPPAGLRVRPRTHVPDSNEWNGRAQGSVRCRACSTGANRRYSKSAVPL